MFDPRSEEKREVGGLITHCPECSEETEVKYLGVAFASGKCNGVEILKFDDERTRAEFQQDWARNIGMDRGKSSALGRAGGMQRHAGKYRKQAAFGGNENHKGKSDEAK